MRPTLPIVTLLILCTGCSANDFFTGGPPTNPAFPSYHAYGDSISAGYTLAEPGIQSFPALIAIGDQFNLSNNAYTGDQACDVLSRQIFAVHDSPSLSHSWLSTLLIGTNDMNTYGLGAYEAVFDLCHQAAISWLALPVEDKILATSAIVITTGPNHIDTTSSFDAWTSDAQGASIAFPFQLPAAAPVYVWYRIIDGNPGTFTYALDGTLLGSMTTQTTPLIQTANGTKSSLALLRLPSVSTGAHRLTFTQTSAGTSGMGIVAIGLPPINNTAALPRILVGTITPQLPNVSLCGRAPAYCAEYTADITANVALLAGDGLNLQLFISGKYMSATSADMNDGVHPNLVGQMEIAHALQDVLQ